MNPANYLSPVLLGLCYALTSSSHAAEALNLQQTKLSALQKQFQLLVPGVKSHGLAKDTLNYLKKHTDKKKIAHIRMQQQYLGFDVFGGYAIIHSKSKANSDKDSSVTGTVYSGLVAELGQPKKEFVQQGTKALDHFLNQYQNAFLSQKEVTPMVFIDADKKAHWAYRVSAVAHFNDRTPEKPTAIIDAETFKSFMAWNNRQTLTPVKGMGFGGNSKTGQFQYGKDLPLLDMVRDDEQSICYMETREVKVVDMQHHKKSDNLPLHFTCSENEANPGVFWTGYQGDGYDQINGAYSPANDALYVGHVIKHMYKDWYDTEVLTNSDGSPMQLVMRVHFRKQLENAEWNGEFMSFGDGGDFFYPLVSLGIGAHEVSHGFTQQHSSLIYYAASGAINESFSDMAAQIADIYATGTNNWLIGSEIVKENSGMETLRYMDQPRKDGQSIDSAKAFEFDMDVHYSSGIYNRLFYLLSTSEGWDPKKAFEVMIKANMDYWMPWLTFDESACGVLSAAHDLDYDLTAIKSAFTEVAINYQACDITADKMI